MKDTQPQGTRQEQPVQAVIGSVKEGKGYATAFPIPGQSLPPGTDITFSLGQWSGKVTPLKSQVVMLDDVTMFARGWRASSARPVTPTSNEDESVDLAGETHG